MRRYGQVLLIFMALVPFALAANPVEKSSEIKPYQGQQLLHTLDRNQKAKVLAYGDGKSGFSGLYVFDPGGNCVVWDDTLVSEVQDDLAVEFVAAQAGRYMVEVRNFSSTQNPFFISIK